jgi:hypothetical protein
MPGPALVLSVQFVLQIAAFIADPTLSQWLNLPRILGILSVLALTCTAITLYRSGMYRRYRIFFAYLIFRVPYSALPWFLDLKGNNYFYYFIYTEPLIMVLYALIVFELYRLVLERYKGLYTLGMWAMAGAMVVSLAVSVVSLAAAPSKLQFRFTSIIELKVEERLDFALVLFILLILAFLSRYPIRLNRNVVVHVMVYSIFFLATTITLTIYLYKTTVPFLIDNILTGIGSACAIAWCIGLTPKGEEVEVHLPSLGPGAEQRVLQQLDALNATLLKVSKK